MDSEDLDRALAVPAARIKWYTYVGDFVNIVKAFIGTNYQALPFAFSQSGVVAGVIGVLLIAVLTDHCCQLLIRSKHHLIRKLCQEETDRGRMSEREVTALRQRLEKIMGYGDIGRHVFGNGCFHVIQIAVCFTQYTTGMAYFIFIANTIYQIIPYEEYVNKTTIINVTEQPIIAHGVPMLYIDNIGRYARDVESVGGYLAGLGNMSTLTPANVSDVTTAAPLMTTTSGGNISSTVEPAPVGPVPFWKPPVDLKYLFLIPLPFFLITCLIKNMRRIAPFSLIATVALALGAVSVLVYLLIDFSVKWDEVEMVKLYTLPVFIGQLTGAFEGIGCVVPIESSMDGNRRIFRWYLHSAISVVACILMAYGVLGYMRYGNSIQQLVVENIDQVGMGPKFVDITLIISVLFTFPLQTFPVMEVFENYIFGSKCGWCSRSPRLEYDEIGTGIQQPEESEEQGLLATASVEESASDVAFVVPPQIPRWKRNILRVLVVLSICGFGIAMRDMYAYLGAFTGALGCSLLAFVLPCMIHLRVRSHTMPPVLIAKDIMIIIFAVAASLLAIVVILYRIVSGQVAL